MPQEHIHAVAHLHARPDKTEELPAKTVLLVWEPLLRKRTTVRIAEGVGDRVTVVRARWS
jgi:hypothetical protein